MQRGRAKPVQIYWSWGRADSRGYLCLADLQLGANPWRGRDQVGAQGLGREQPRESRESELAGPWWSLEQQQERARGQEHRRQREQGGEARLLLRSIMAWAFRLRCTKICRGRAEMIRHLIPPPFYSSLPFPPIDSSSLHPTNLLFSFLSFYSHFGFHRSPASHCLRDLLRSLQHHGISA